MPSYLLAEGGLIEVSGEDGQPEGMRPWHAGVGDRSLRSLVWGREQCFLTQRTIISARGE